ncbi:MAG TPA: hypothetical protein VH137_10385, partial [Gemmatimonadales bacterium]|nr:hypothetical protein [Gemmatimonadales bacterium]
MMTPSDLPAPLAAVLPPPRSEEALRPAPLALVEPGLDVDGGLDWRRVGAAVLRFKWMILAATLLGGLAGAAATRFLKPEYLAQGTIWIDETGRSEGRGADRGPMGPGQLLDREAWVDLLRSFAVLDDVVRAQRLFLTAQPPADSTALATFAVGDRYRPGEYQVTADA